MRPARHRFQDPPLPVPVREGHRSKSKAADNSAAASSESALCGLSPNPSVNHSYPPDPLFPCNGLCYNLRAVERAAKEGAASVHPERRVRLEPGASVSLETAPGFEEPKANAGSPKKDSAPHEDASRYCPVCSQRLTSRRCKLICTVCGYYMSCADYY